MQQYLWNRIEKLPEGVGARRFVRVRGSPGGGMHLPLSRFLIQESPEETVRRLQASLHEQRVAAAQAKKDAIAYQKQLKDED